MIAFNVEWTDVAADSLAAVFLRSSDPNSIWPAQYRADRKLEQRPRTVGVELSEGLWQLIEPPLKIFYEIDDAKQVVTVTHVEPV